LGDARAACRLHHRHQLVIAMTDAARLRALRLQLRADREALRADIEAREQKLAADPLLENDRLFAEPSPLVRSARAPAIIRRVHENAPIGAAAAASADPDAIDEATDAILWMLAEERAARRAIVAEMRAALDEFRGRLDLLAAMVGAERGNVISLPAWPPKRDDAAS
jgi:hypothetical protein